MASRFNLIVVLSLCLSLCLFPTPTASLQQNFYANICPNVENIVRDAVKKKFNQTFVTVPATIRLFFHDCFVQVNMYFNAIGTKFFSLFICGKV